MITKSKSLKTKLVTAASVAGLALNFASAVPVLASETKPSTYDLNTTMGYSGPPEAALENGRKNRSNQLLLKV